MAKRIEGILKNIRELYTIRVIFFLNFSCSLVIGGLSILHSLHLSTIRWMLFPSAALDFQASVEISPDFHFNLQ